MMTSSVHHGVILAAIAAGSIALAPVAHAQVALPNSSAFGLSASFTVGANTTKLGPVGQVAGSGLPYNNTINVASYSDTLAIAAGTTEIATFDVLAGAIHSNVNGSFGIDTNKIQGDGRIGSVSVTLQQFPPPPFIVLPPLLSIAATTVTDSATATTVLPKAPSVTGAASVNTLTISGRLIGGQTLTFSGSAPANTILYSSPTVTITLDAQSKDGVITCIIGSSGCTFIPGALTTRAIDVVLTNTNIGGHTVSGEIVIGDSNATLK